MNQRSVLWVLGGCLAMAIAVVAIFIFGVPVNSVLLVALVLACPLAHLLMMRAGMHEHAKLPSPQRLDAPEPATGVVDSEG